MEFSARPSTVLERFLRYVRIDTQSDPDSAASPSTEKQKNLSRLLVEELQALGVTDAHLDAHGYVYATLPATTPARVPTICFCAHVDTSPDCPGAHVRPIVHENYQGQDIALPDDPTQVICLAEHPALARQIGNDLITASGTTLLGADNKAGVAAIMDAAAYLMQHPEVPHGRIRLLFTPDEEVGRGTEHVDLGLLGADFAYTIDGEDAGTLENETFSADAATVTFTGVSQHPGFAKGCLVSALKLAAELVASLPQDRLSPETTEGREGFLHPTDLQGSVETATVKFIIRDFTEEGLLEKEQFLQQAAQAVAARHPPARVQLQVQEQYRNMKAVLEAHPQVTELAMEAIRRSGLQPELRSIRGGTDGSRLSMMGLPCPNIFAGEHAFHSRQEWVSRQDMEKAAEVVVRLSALWAEKSS